MYIPNYDPLGNVWLSALVALLPILTFFISLVVFKVKGHVAAFFTVVVASLIAVVVYDMSIAQVTWSFLYGAAYGIVPIAWIIIAAIFLYKLCVKSGYFNILRESIISITPDQRIQVILIGFCFGAFLEGAIGFGGPVAITAALLVGLGLTPLYAAGLCMIANTAPVAFGAVGIPIIAMGGVVGIDPKEISYVVGHLLPPLSIFVPLFLVFLMNGFKGLKEIWPVALVAGASFAITQYVTATHLGPELPDIASAVVSIICVVIFLRFWQPKNIFKFDNKTTESKIDTNTLSRAQILKAWLPFIILIVGIVIWSLDKFKALFKADGVLKSLVFSIHIPTLSEVMQNEPVVASMKSVSSVFSIPLINTVGTCILIVALISALLLKINIKTCISTFSETLNEMKIAILTICLVVGFAFISGNSGISASIALALTHTGDAFSFFSPIIGWIGVFITGSDTTSNILFGQLQQITANSIGVNENLLLAANAVGGVVGKMISPQSVAIACAAVGLVGRESELIKFTLKYSIAFVVGIGIFIYVLAHIGAF